MDNTNQKTPNDGTLKPYESPAIVEEETFETMTLGCGTPRTGCGGSPSV